MENKILSYNGNTITFQLGNGDVMINATEMAKPFGKRPIDYLKNQQTIDFIHELSKVRKSTLTDLVKVTKGGSNPGTWMHEDVALEFARWLNPAFAIWCNDRIKELLKIGFTATENKIDELVQNPDLLISLATQLKEERAEKERLRSQNELQSEELRKQAPKVEYFNEVLQSESTYNTNQIAKELGMSAITLNRKLQEMRIQYKQNGTWLLYHNYQDRGYTKTKTHTYTDTNGITQTSMQTVWTEKGRAFIHHKLKVKEKRKTNST